ncbi:MAG: hypothetical protein ACD_75C02078G0003, partial [uncultured bacterium]
VITMQEIYSFEQIGIDKDGLIQGSFRTHGVRPKFFEKFIRMGVPIPEKIFETL